jgi:hypothetical protein
MKTNFANSETAGRATLDSPFPRPLNLAIHFHKYLVIDL